MRIQSQLAISEYFDETSVIKLHWFAHNISLAWAFFIFRHQPLDKMYLVNITSVWHCTFSINTNLFSSLYMWCAWISNNKYNYRSSVRKILSHFLKLNDPCLVPFNKEMSFKENKKEKNLNKLLKGCNCKRTKCKKNFCECYKNSKRCTEYCKCLGK